MNRYAVAPLGDGALAPGLGLLLALVPVQRDRRHVAARAVLVDGVHRGRGDLGVRRGAEGLDRPRGVELQRPERQVVPVAAEVAHGAVAEIPPSVPLGPGVDTTCVERPLGAGPSQRSQSSPAGTGCGSVGPLEHEERIV